MNEPSQRHLKKDALCSSLGIIGIIIFFVSTNPQTMPAFGLLLLPILVGITAYIATGVILRTFTSTKDRLVRTVAVSITVGSLIVVTLGSFGQLGFQDFLLALLLVSGSMFYIKRLQTN